MQKWHEEWAIEALRVLKPGGHLLAFGGTRTYHRLACAIEDSGFEIRDCIVWVYGQGFPKSQNVSKMIDKMAGAKRPVIGPRIRVDGKAPGVVGNQGGLTMGAFGDLPITVTGPATSEAQQWDGWGTALKPAMEPIVVARKPLIGTVVKNVLKYGMGALNIDGCRILTDENLNGGAYAAQPNRDQSHSWSEATGMYEAGRSANSSYEQPIGRWPANVILDEEAAQILDEQTWHLKAGGDLTGDEPTAEAFSGPVYGNGKSREGWRAYGDSGGASRFFYCAKASTVEREAGLREAFSPTMGNGIGGKEHDPETATKKFNKHPTVKPIDLMRYLVRLVTPPGGLVLDPFCGSGTTGIAALQEGFRFLGIEREQEYVDIARARIEHHVGPQEVGQFVLPQDWFA
jgi:site-specific DNA-methyltransferase (adenine-specific)